MASVRVRYPGRICLLGEHCDWAGGSSLTVPTPMGIDVRADSARDGVLVRSEMDGEFLEQHFSADDRIPASGPLRFIPAIMAELESAGIQTSPAELWVQSDLPAGRGLSSSASFSLGVLDALSRLSGRTLLTSELVERAYQVERTRLGIGCGRLDPAACAAAQPLLMQWTPDSSGEVAMHATRVEPLGSIHLTVGVMDKPRDTRRILRTLNKHNASPVGNPDGDAVREAICEFGAAADRGAHALRNGNMVALGAAMDTAQRVYEANLESRFGCMRAPRLRTIVTGLRTRGALGAKFSGAGGDGSVVALSADENAARSTAIWLERQGLKAWYTPIEAP